MNPQPGLPPESPILTINGGSSSLKFSLYRRSDPPLLELSGKIERIGMKGTELTFFDAGRGYRGGHSLTGGDHASAAQHLFDWLGRHRPGDSIAAIGHRIVHGGARLHEPQIITTTVLEEMGRIGSYAPEHLPAEIAMVRLFAAKMPDVPQVACFDTAFHRNMPRVAKLLPIPRHYQEAGIERYGFHGLSYTYLMEELERVGGRKSARGNVVLAHLGNGASLAAVRDGVSIDTSMGFTPAAGLPMGTRSGDLDPGLVAYFARSEGLSAEQFDRMVNHESGLLGISGSSSDVRDLLANESADPRAADAVALFCYQAGKWIGAFAAALGGLDTLVFSGGIGENSPAIRSRICRGLGFLGIQLDESHNARNAPVISARRKPCVRVIRTDEDIIIAKSVFRVLSSCLQPQSGRRP